MYDLLYNDPDFGWLTLDGFESELEAEREKALCIMTNTAEDLSDIFEMEDMYRIDYVG